MHDTPLLLFNSANMCQFSVDYFFQIEAFEFLPRVNNTIFEMHSMKYTLIFSDSTMNTIKQLSKTFFDFSLFCF